MLDYWKDGPPRDFQGISSYRCNILATSPSELRHANQVWARGSKEFGTIEIDFLHYYPQYPTILLFHYSVWAEPLSSLLKDRMTLFVMQLAYLLGLFCAKW